MKTARRKVASTKQSIKNRTLWRPHTLEVGEGAGPEMAIDLRLGVSL